MSWKQKKRTAQNWSDKKRQRRSYARLGAKKKVSQESKSYRKAAKSIIKKAWREEKKRRLGKAITLKLAGRPRNYLHHFS